MNAASSQSNRLSGMWANWINERHTSPDTFAQAQDAIRAGEAALPFKGLWKEVPFLALSKAVPNLTWEKMRVLRDGGAAVRQVTELEFYASPQALRFSAHDRAICLDEALNGNGTLTEIEQKALRYFFAFAILTPALSTWVSMVLDTDQISATSVEFTRYASEDFISPHTDAVGTRVANLVTYFDQENLHAGGGVLVARNKAGQERTFLPSSRDAVLLPVHPEQTHWVTPWKNEVGRYTVSIGFSRGSA
ncbi:2OG-Fe(II) oxygenase [Sulfitobacter sp. R86518]|uniref:2OG-Fe(II) oxygenase n=1 Tax=Sulfitobacter sp. R86518 TaxID=3093858 RepID=UPI0036D9BE79